MHARQGTSQILIISFSQEPRRRQLRRDIQLTRLLRIWGAGPAPLPLDMRCSRILLIPWMLRSISSSDSTGLSVLLPATQTPLKPGIITQLL